MRNDHSRRGHAAAPQARLVFRREARRASSDGRDGDGLAIDCAARALCNFSFARHKIDNSPFWHFGHLRYNARWSGRRADDSLA